VLLCLLRHDHLPLDVLAGRLAGLTLPIPVTVALPPPEDRALSDVWSALGGELKPSLDLVVISPFEAGPTDLAATLVQEGVRLNVAISDRGREEPRSPGGTSRGGASRSNRSKGRDKTGSAAGGQAGEETVVGGTGDKRGRIFRLRDTTHTPGTRGDASNGGED
jgi:hypothetical protein